MGAIFLSASVPTRPPFDADSRPQEIQAAINALAQVALGRKKLGFSQDCAWEKRFSCGEQPRTALTGWCDA
jgi:hypothetical protein